ncbi:MAG TPA: MFS transporter [Chitinispirillaceae bacterium]|nr:MFS transporter [Chitinispirillaceae bacterium]
MNSTQVIEKTIPVVIENRRPVSAEKELCLGGVPVGCKENCTGLKYSLWDGIFSNAMLALMETFSVAAAVFINAPPLAISILSSLPLLLSSIGQFLIPRIIDPSRGRKHYVLRGTLSQSVFLFILGFTGWLSPQVRPWAYVIIFSLYGFSGNVVSGLWIAWMGDMIPSSVRGRHFAWRNRFFSATQLVCAIGAGIISRKYTTDNAPWLFFAFVFFGASFFRLISSFMLNCQYEPPNTATNSSDSLLTSLKSDRNFLFYSVSAALMLGTVAISGPFFNVWYVRDLKFDYFTLSVAAAATILGTIISLPFWGKLADSMGNRRVILWTGFLVSTVPIPYIFSSYSWQIWVLNFYTGLCWSGYNLSNFNYLLSAAGKVKPEKKISISVAITGLSVFFFSLLGGFLSTRLPAIFGWQLKTLFLLSSVLRFVIYGFLFFRFPSYEAEHLKSMEVFHQIPGYRAGMGILRNAFRAVRRV